MPKTLGPKYSQRANVKYCVINGGNFMGPAQNIYFLNAKVEPFLSPLPLVIMAFTQIMIIWTPWKSP